MRIRLFLSVAFLFAAVQLSAQMKHPSKWTTSLSSEYVRVGDEIELIFSVTIEKNWYLYSSDFDPECGPTVTSFTFEPNAGYQLVGIVKAIKPILKHDQTFGCDVKIFHDKAEFRQRIKVLSADLIITGNSEFQTCTDIDGTCVPDNFDFKFDKFKVGQKKATTPQKKTEISTAAIVKDSVKSAVPLLKSPDPTSPSTVVSSVEITGPVFDKKVLDGQQELDDSSLIGFLIIAFIAGFTSLVTPCIFPMIPMTVTFFLRDNQTRRQGVKKAVIFGLSIIAIYTTAGTLMAFLLGTDGLNALSTHWALNLFVFVIFIIFAISFFGLFEINAPYKLVNKMDSQADKGGLAGIFFMAATLVLVSFSCTIPIVGSVLVLAAGGAILKPILAMFFYSLAIAVPFTLFAVFPQAIQSLPKSGGWLNSVKVTLGFLELALCLKFFSIADQTYHWGLLDRDINITLWIVIFSLLGFYLLGKIRLPNDSVLESLGVPRLILAITVFAFVVYLIPGLFGAPLKMLAGYLPPKSTLDFDLATEASGGVKCEEAKYKDLLHLPHGIDGYFDYKQAVICARQQNKPLFLDFTGHGCTNCREMEATVWSDPEVLRRLKSDFVVVALYVDDKTELPESEWVTSNVDGKVKKTIGKINANIQISRLDNNAQPYYVLVNPADEKVLAWPYAYKKSPEEFVKFLERGKKKFKELAIK